MEIMIRIKDRTFSIGHKGFRKVSHQNWKNAFGAFEALVRFQSDKMAKDDVRLKAHIKKKTAEWAVLEESPELMAIARFGWEATGKDWDDKDYQGYHEEPKEEEE